MICVAPLNSENLKAPDAFEPRLSCLQHLSNIGPCEKGRALFAATVFLKDLSSFGHFTGVST